ncbi:MAG: glycosyltransferase family 4 protein [Actinomycetota bacterium]
MRVAIVSPHPITPADSGDRIRTTALCRALIERGVDAFVVAYAWEGERSSPRDAVRYVPGRPAGAARQLWRLRLAAARRTNAFALHQNAAAQAAMRRELDALRPDVVDFQHSYTWFQPGRPNVLTVHNVESDRLSRFAGLPRSALDGAIDSERAAVESASATVVLSDLDGTRLCRLATPRSLHVVPIGYDPGPPRPQQREDCVVAAYVGSMDYEPNVEAGRLLLCEWQGIRKSTGLQRLLVVGRQASAHFRPDETVEVLSDVPDVRLALEPADVLVVPVVSGGGVRVKIIEAFGLGLPVVSTALGIEGLGAVDGEHAVIVEGVADLADGLSRLADRGLREQLAANARALWVERYSPAGMAAAMTAVYEAAGSG